MKKKVHLVAAARPNFMKIAPLYHALDGESWVEPSFIQVRQHYDDNMSDAFVRLLELPNPLMRIEVGRGTQAEQTAAAMTGYAGACEREKPDFVVVAGDVNSTLACALTACKLGLRVAHLEAGLRSRDRTMPEEINRILTDHVSDVLWTPSADADTNLKSEGIELERIRCVGNIMIDSLEMTRPQWQRMTPWENLGLESGGYGMVTLHRPFNVDHPSRLSILVDQLEKISFKMPILFPLHPRTRLSLESCSLWDRLISIDGMRLLDPLGYLEFLSYLSRSAFIITDSGGVQEESTYLGIPCITVRPNTERPITLTEGTNQLATPEQLSDCVSEFSHESRQIPDLWDGQTAARVAGDLAERIDA